MAEKKSSALVRFANDLGAKVKAGGKKFIGLYYSRESGGKAKWHVRNIIITTALLGAIAGGTYLIMRHKKHGLVLKKKDKKEKE